jgi:Kdo2-lipid IVA lauroyltransferase/acyltransferase
LSGLLLRVVARIVGVLPFRWLPVLGSALAFLVFRVLRIRRAHVESSLSRARLPDVASGVYRQLGSSVFELLWLSARPSVSAKELVELHGRERFEAARALGRGVIVATAHTGNWDLAACACASITPLAVVTKRLSSRSTDRFWQETRAARGVDLIAAPDGGVFAAARERLRAGRSVAVLVDQDPERTTAVIDAPFLGERALHDTFAAALAARTGAPIVVALARRTATGHVVEVVDVIVPGVRPGRRWVDETTRRIAARVEAFVRTSPAMWLWLHRRWKTRGTTERRAVSDSGRVLEGSTR